MVKYLIDVNLPYYFSLWNSPEYIHQIDIAPTEKDKIFGNMPKNVTWPLSPKTATFPTVFYSTTRRPKLFILRLVMWVWRNFIKLFMLVGMRYWVWMLHTNWWMCIKIELRVSI